MRNRLAGAFAATLIASAALVACSPPNEQPSDISVTDQENPDRTFENGGASESSSASTSPEMTMYNDGYSEGYQEPAVQ